MDSLCRKTIQVNLVRIPPQLKELASRIPELSIQRETWSPTQLGHLQHRWGHDESALSVLWSFTPLLHISWLSTCAYFGRILSTLEDYYSQSTTFQRYGKRSKAIRDCSSPALALIWCHNSLGNKEWCQRFPNKFLVWESLKLLEFLGFASLWGNCGSPHLWDGFVSKSWPTHRCKRC